MLWFIFFPFFIKVLLQYIVVDVCQKSRRYGNRNCGHVGAEEEAEIDDSSTRTREREEGESQLEMKEPP